jgi:hypothetical protein
MDDKKTRDSAPLAEFGELLKQMESLVRVVAPQKRELVELISAVRHVVSGSSASSVNEFLGELRTGRRIDAARKPDSKEQADFRRASLEDVEKLLDDSDVTKAILLRVAETRFGAPRGVLTRLNRNDLVDRLRTLIADERSHDAIARLASTRDKEER